MARLNKEATPARLDHPTNNDEDIYPNKIGSYSKGLLHQANGEVVLSAYESMLNALRSGRPEDFDAITTGGNIGLTNPQSGLAFELEGGDAHSFVMPPAPLSPAAKKPPRSRRTTGWRSCAMCRSRNTA